MLNIASLVPVSIVWIPHQLPCHSSFGLDLDPTELRFFSSNVANVALLQIVQSVVQSLMHGQHCCHSSDGCAPVSVCHLGIRCSAPPWLTCMPHAYAFTARSSCTCHDVRCYSERCDKRCPSAGQSIAKGHCFHPPNQPTSKPACQPASQPASQPPMNVCTHELTTLPPNTESSNSTNVFGSCE